MIKYYISLMLFFCLSCINNSSLLNEKLIKKLPSSFQINQPALFIVYNEVNSCIGCNFTIENFFKNNFFLNTIPSSNILVILKEKREREKSNLKNELLVLGVNYEMIYDNEIYNSFINKITSFKNAGGILLFDKKGNLKTECSFKDENFFKKLDPTNFNNL